MFTTELTQLCKWQNINVFQITKQRVLCAFAIDKMKEDAKGREK